MKAVKVQTKEQKYIINDYEEGKLIDPEHIITMDWLLDNVVGRLPRYDELTDNAKLKMALQGVVKEEE